MNTIRWSVVAMIATLMLGGCGSSGGPSEPIDLPAMEEAHPVSGVALEQMDPNGYPWLPWKVSIVLDGERGRADPFDSYTGFIHETSTAPELSFSIHPSLGRLVKADMKIVENEEFPKIVEGATVWSAEPGPHVIRIEGLKGNTIYLGHLVLETEQRQVVVPVRFRTAE